MDAGINELATDIHAAGKTAEALALLAQEEGDPGDSALAFDGRRGAFRSKK